LLFEEEGVGIGIGVTKVRKEKIGDINMTESFGFISD